MTRILLILSVLLIAGGAFAQGIIIGNPGQGYLGDDGKLYLFDLHEGQIETKPETSLKLIGPALRGLKWKLRALDGLGLNEETVLAKLEDANYIQDELGLILLEVISQYSWVLTTEKMAPFPEGADDLGIIVPRDRLVPLAVRDGATILIERDNFEKLDEANRVALILHEALSALLKVETLPTGESVQLSSPARQIVVQLFKSRAECIAETGSCLKEALKNKFAIDWEGLHCGNERPNATFSINSAASPLVWRWQVELGSEASAMLPAATTKAAEYVCGVFHKDEDPQAVLAIDAVRLPFEAVPYEYFFDGNGHPHKQVAFQIKSRPASLFTWTGPPLQTLKKDYFTCVAILSTRISDWMAGRSFGPGFTQTSGPDYTEMTCR